MPNQVLQGASYIPVNTKKNEIRKCRSDFNHRSLFGDEEKRADQKNVKRGLLFDLGEFFKEGEVFSVIDILK